MIRQAIVQARLNKGWSMRKTALYSKIQPSTLGRFENGKGDLTSRQLARLLALLNFSIMIDDFNVLSVDELSAYLAMNEEQILDRRKRKAAIEAHLRKSLDRSLLHNSSSNHAEDPKSDSYPASQNPHSTPNYSSAVRAQTQMSSGNLPDSRTVPRSRATPQSLPNPARHS